MRGRELIECVLAGETPSRMPVYGVITSDGLIEHEGGEVLTRQNAEELAARTYRQHIDLTRPFKENLGPTFEESLTIDDFGYTWQEERWTQWRVKTPYQTIAQMKEVLGKQIDFFRSWQPDPEKRTEEVLPIAAPNAAEKIQKMLGSDTLVTGWLPIGTAPGCYFRDGLENFCYLLADFPKVVTEWAQTRHQMNLRKIDAMADPVNCPLEFIDADIAYRNGLLFSPQYFRETGWFTRLAELVDCFHSHGVAVVFHSDGDLRAIMPELVGTGIDGLNPIETAAGMSIGHLHKAFPRLILVGGLDNHTLINATTDEVRKVTLQALKDGGNRLIVGSSTEEFDASMKVENIMAALETIYEYQPQ